MQNQLIAPVVIGTIIGTLIVVALILLKWRPVRTEHIEGPPRFYAQLSPCDMDSVAATATIETKDYKRAVAFLDLELEDFAKDNFGPGISPVDVGELRKTLQSWPFVAEGRLPVDELVTLAKKRQATFIRHFLATEIFSVIEVDRNPEFTLLWKDMVALAASLHRIVPQESDSQSKF